MEAAALEAYRKDVENSADFTSKAIKRKINEDNLQVRNSKKLWKEAKTDGGHTYYWNVITNESVWEPPKEGYISLSEQENESLIKSITLKQGHNINFGQRSNFGKQNIEKEMVEEKARLAREKMKERRIEDLPTVVHAPIIPPGKTDPYGQWETVTMSESITPVDFQLPNQEPAYEMPVFEPEPSIPKPREFKEKTVESLGVSDGTTFKKRKIGIGARRNVRRPVDED